MIDARALATLINGGGWGYKQQALDLGILSALKDGGKRVGEICSILGLDPMRMANRARVSRRLLVLREVGLVKKEEKVGRRGGQVRLLVFWRNAEWPVNCQ